MPLRRNMSHRSMVEELINKYKQTGKIGNTKPKNMQQALDIANAIAYRVKRTQKRGK